MYLISATNGRMATKRTESILGRDQPVEMQSSNERMLRTPYWATVQHADWICSLSPCRSILKFGAFSGLELFLRERLPAQLRPPTGRCTT